MSRRGRYCLKMFLIIVLLIICTSLNIGPNAAWWNTWFYNLIFQITMFLLKIVQKIGIVFNYLLGEQFFKWMLHELNMNEHNLFYMIISILAGGVIMLAAILKVINLLFTNQESWKINNIIKHVFVAIIFIITFPMLFITINNYIFLLMGAIFQHHNSLDTNIIADKIYQSGFTPHQLMTEAEITNITLNYQWSYDQKHQFHNIIVMIGAGVIIWTLTSMCLCLIQRMFEILLLFLLGPLAIAWIAYDGGKHFKNWQTTLVSKTLLIFGLNLNLFIFISVISKLYTINHFMIFNKDDFFANVILKLLLLIASGIFLVRAQHVYDQVFKIKGNLSYETQQMSSIIKKLKRGVFKK